MKTRTRFIKSIVAAAQNEDVQMPWTRGATRAATIARRNAKVEVRRARSA